MDIRSVGLVTIFMALPAACLIYGWWQSSDTVNSESWRQKLLQLGFPFASLSLLLTSAFLIRGWRWHEQSFADRPPTYWAVLNWINLLSWVFGCFAALLGKGKLRRSLMVWCISLPLFAWIAFMLGFDY